MTETRERAVALGERKMLATYLIALFIAGPTTASASTRTPGADDLDRGSRGPTYLVAGGLLLFADGCRTGLEVAPPHRHPRSGPTSARRIPVLPHGRVARLRTLAVARPRSEQGLQLPVGGAQLAR